MQFLTSLFIFIDLILVLAIFLGLPFYTLYYVAFKRKNVAEADLKALAWPQGFAWAAGGVVLIYNIFIHDILSNAHYHPGIGIGLFMSGIAFAFWKLLPKEKRNAVTHISALLASISFLAIAFRANGFVHSLDMLLGFAALFVLWTQHALPNAWVRLGWLLKTAIINISRAVDHVFTLIQSVFQIRKIDKSPALSALKTGFITLVVLVIFLNLLSEADPIFAQMVQTFREQIWGRGVLSILMILVFTFAMSFKLRKPAESEKNISWLNFQDLFWPTLTSSLLFGLFGFVQWKYLFAGAEHFQALDMTYSEYVRKGFMELLVAILFGGLLNHITALVARDADGKSKKILQILNSILIVELVALLASAWLRNNLYIETYGITRIRIAGEVLLAWLGALLAGIMIFNWVRKVEEKQIFIWMSVFSIGAIGILNVINMDMKIANTPSSTGEMDYFYVAHLSTDAAPAWATIEAKAQEFYTSILDKKTLNADEQEKLADFRIAINVIAEQEERLETMKENVFFWNWSQSRALHTERSEEAKKLNSCLRTGMDAFILSRALVGIPEVEWDRMNKYEYPLTSRMLGESFSYSPRYEDDIYNQILLEHPELKAEFDAEFGEYNNWDFRSKLDENLALKAKFEVYMNPQPCAL